MKNSNVIFFDAKPYDIKSFDEVNKGYRFNIKYIKSHLNEETARLAYGFDTICVFVNDKVNKKVISDLYSNKVKLIALRCAGYNNIDIKEAYRHIHVVRVPAYSPHAVAEHTVALLLCLNRKIHKSYYRTRDNNFNIDGLLGFDLYKKTAGIIGTGKIGCVLIKILNGFGMKIIAYDRFPDQSLEKELSFNYVNLDELYKISDVLSLNCPLTPETYHMINSNSISKLKTGVVVINTGRGQLIETKALIDGLKSKKISAAGLDVYEEESEYFFEDFSNEIIEDDTLARLLTFNNVLLTSHQGFFTKEALLNIASTTLKNIKDYFTGNRLENEICYKCSETRECPRKKYGRCF